MNLHTIDSWFWGPFNDLFIGYLGFLPGVKRSVRDVEHSPPSSAEVMNEWSSITVHPTHLYDVDRDSVTFTFTFTQSFVFGIMIVLLYFLVSNRHGRHATKGRTDVDVATFISAKRWVFLKGMSVTAGRASGDHRNCKSACNITFYSRTKLVQQIHAP